ncbi:hypothetical protein WJX75_008745 [Coccomyxa subellipsoidea]|uniref:Peptidylprolyl isomerase n=1 Tax=Coccomyxa subellipsoidea TaxID=248742 RepID=A0ABR2YGY0_9CHLO
MGPRPNLTRALIRTCPAVKWDSKVQDDAQDRLKPLLSVPNRQEVEAKETLTQRRSLHIRPASEVPSSALRPNMTVPNDLDGAAPKGKVLIANRGEIARRVQRSCRQLGLIPVAVYTEPDALSLHVLEAEEKVCLGKSTREYTNAAKLLEAALSTGCKAVHPGYGFLSENAEFVESCESAGVAFLGPTAATMRMFSRKHTAREFAQSANVPVLPGSTIVTSEEEAVAEAAATGYPVLLKATGGGGGIGIYTCPDEAAVRANFEAAGRQGKASFGDAGVFVEKYVQRARHIEVQIFGDGKGGIVTLPERECSIQRRHQKVVEESPSPYVEEELRAELKAAARRLGEAAKYRSAGTIEYLVDQDTSKFYFLEVNTRLQVEHGITEMVSGLDLVDWQLQLQVPGLTPPDMASASAIQPEGWAFEVRINAEDPFRNFTPSSGVLGQVVWPPGVRIDTWVETGTEVTPFYDSLLGKLMVHGKDRPDAVAKMAKALSGTVLGGIPSNLQYLSTIIASEGFHAGATTTRFLESLPFTPKAIEVVAPGMNTTVQDYPGRTKVWHVGVPPSGPMDALAFRLANALVGNATDAAGLEITLSGPSLRFHMNVIIALSGAEFHADIDGVAVPFWTSVLVKSGSTLNIGTMAAKRGARCYVAVAGGIDTPVYLGSRSTFPGGKLGGVQGRPLKAGDLLPLGPSSSGVKAGNACPKAWIPAYPAGGAAWEIGVLPGPNAAPDYFTEADIKTFYSAPYTVHYNSNRLGIRLTGPRPQFARTDGGEGGSHPSNVHDHVYAIGTINFTGDMPVALMFDGPSLGGFVCPATITSTELWKMGQVSAKDTVLFKPVTLETAYKECLAMDKKEELLRAAASSGSANVEAALAAYSPAVPAMPPTEAVLRTLPAQGDFPGAQFRLAGDRYVFVEYGPMELDLNLRVRVHELEGYLADKAVPGIVETSPGVRSCMIEYDQRVLPLGELLSLLEATERALPSAQDQVLPTRIVHLPLAFNEKWTHDAIAKYMKSVRKDAPYVPSNVDFVAANNGLEGGADAVREVVEKAAYMVLGLGDVYLGAPCAVPVDPRHRLVVPKYNPARTFSPEGAVGLGGAYMCIYPMESPGGYQLIGRTLPIWNTFGRTAPFSPDTPWLLRYFDQVKYEIVSEEELETQRKQFHNGQLQLKIEEQTFSMKEYNSFVASVAGEVEALRKVQAVAVAEQMALDEASLQRLEAEKAKSKVDGDDPSEHMDTSGLEVTSAFTANVWEVKCKVGDVVTKGQTLVVLEAMKMEYPITAPSSGQVKAVRVEASDLTQQGDVLLLIEPSEE